MQTSANICVCVCVCECVKMSVCFCRAAQNALSKRACNLTLFFLRCKNNFVCFSVCVRVCVFVGVFGVSVYLFAAL